MVDGPRRNPEILIVEDNQTVQFLIGVVIANEDDWRPTCVGDAETAINMWENGNFDLILMDMMLPGINGIEAMKKIRSIEKSTGRRHTPIIFLTAVEENNFCKQAIASGADDCINKPADLEKVVDKIYEYIPGLLR